MALSANNALICRQPSFRKRKVFKKRIGILGEFSGAINWYKNCFGMKLPNDWVKQKLKEEDPMKKFIYTALVLGAILFPVLSRANSLSVIRDRDSVVKAMNSQSVVKGADKDFNYKAIDKDFGISVVRGENGETVIHDGNKEIVIREVDPDGSVVDEARD